MMLMKEHGPLIEGMSIVHLKLSYMTNMTSSAFLSSTVQQNISQYTIHCRVVEHSVAEFTVV
jgi:hypothetical protein